MANEDMRFRMKNTYGSPNPHMDLAQILIRRTYNGHSQGQMEDMQDAIDLQGSMLTSVMEFLLRKGLATAEDICDIVNSTRGGQDIEAVKIGRD